MFISKTGADYVPNLSTAARQGYNLVISVGFLMGDATAAVASRFPNTKFAIIDFPAAGLKGKPKNDAAYSSRSRRPATSSATSPGCSRRTSRTARV